MGLTKASPKPDAGSFSVYDLMIAIAVNDLHGLLRCSVLHPFRQRAVTFLVSLNEEVFGKIKPERDQRRAVNFLVSVANAAFSRSCKQVQIVEPAGPLRLHANRENVKVTLKVVKLLSRPSPACPSY